MLRCKWSHAALLVVFVFCTCGGLAQNATIDQPALEGIWRLSLGQKAVTMVIHQYEDQLFGSASSSEESWNGVAMGSTNNSTAEIIITFLRDGGIAEIRLIGSCLAEEMRGTFYRSDSIGNAESGEFDAILINPDTSGYTPVKEAQSDIVTTQPESTTTSSNTTSVDSSETQGTGAQSRYTDVHSLAHLVPPAAGVIPPGINMGGAGGMGMS
ncbi:MAG: hypothetical protein H5T42_04555 [Methanothrix sp.]|uniref:Uncharacterized protein n=1 Tax=Methanothrix thermoacetophila (strain DSM 6194 / JCM 14653 / NBRC 101360 / PT) TaxID=349307 RepID=A0B651_METTP|nr:MULTISPECIES: hypothetical protein [Methanothrix]ABK14175.1 hypothetical protein Mthe_0382 [Methanothrix thermoacetophila PT]MBC7079726.1 hypothetical protein [Methanothrix sp.]NPU87801.1 hypothetical protein [Methanothrix sp.]